ncbi:MAG: nucleotide exchange factor GrpE [bacterium]|nr:nucleotide exchange factor GrpE [bacterium]
MAGKVKKDKKDIELQLARALADYDNLVKRWNREREEVVLRATKGLVEDLLPVVDSIERAQEYLKDEGLKMALTHLHKVLQERGVEMIEVALGDQFDSRLHEALDAVPGGNQGTIAEILAQGYRWKDGMVIRPVKVRVYGEENKEK